MSTSSSGRFLTVITLFGAFASLPHVAQAQVYKCARADGSVSYQGTPCPNSKLPPPAAPVPAPAPSHEPYYDPYAPANASQRPTIVAPPLPRAPVEPPAPRVTAVATRAAAAQRTQDTQRAQDTTALKQEVDRLKAQEQANRCATARQQVGVNKEERPIYHYDKDGNRVFVDDKDRARSLATAQQRVAQECN
jgi:hypothetical protein